MSQQIPIAQPVIDNNPNSSNYAQPIIPIVPINSVYNHQTNLNYRPINTLSSIEPISLPVEEQVRCRDCNKQFTRFIKDRGSSGYYRCQDCQKKLLGRSLCASCLIS